MSRTLEETVKNVALKIVDSLILANQELSRYLESPFLPNFERNKLLVQIRENQRVIEKILPVKIEKAA